MWLILTFVVNSGLNFLLSLAVAAVLGPEEYGRFAVAFMTAVVMGTILFDWLRLSATRFYGVPSPGERAALRSSLDGGYLAAAVLLAAGTLLVLALGIDVKLGAGLLVIAAVTAMTSGAFEYGAALARALFLNRAYGQLVMLKNGLAFASMIAAAWSFGSAAAVLAMFSLSAFLATLSVRRILRDPEAALSGASRQRLLAFARYGWPIVAANLAYQGIMLVNRAAATAMLGYAAAGQLSLATDVTIRVLLSVGAALDVLLFQVAVRRDATDGPEAANRQVARNMVLVSAALVLVAILFAGLMPAFEALVVPARYRGAFGEIGTALIPGGLAFCLVQFALSPVFQLAGRTAPVLVTALVAATADVVGLSLVRAEPSLATLAWIHTAALCAGFVAAAIQVVPVRECRPPLRDLGAILLAAGLTGLLMWPIRSMGSPALPLLAAGLIATPGYVAVLLACDVAGLREIAERLAARLSGWWPGRFARHRA